MADTRKYFYWNKTDLLTECCRLANENEKIKRERDELLVKLVGALQCNDYHGAITQDVVDSCTTYINQLQGENDG